MVVGNKNRFCGFCQQDQGVFYRHFERFQISALLYFLVLGILFSTVLVKVTNLWIVSLLTIGIIGYLIFLLVYLNRERGIALANYQEYHKALGQLQKEWDKLEEIYEDEERKQISLNGGEAIAEKIREADKADEV